MLEYGRKISYIREWKHGTWESGYGYLKTVLQENKGTIELFLEKDLKGKNVKLGFYRVKDDKLSICMDREECGKSYSFHPADVEGISAEMIDGVILKLNERIFYGEWTEKDFDYDKAEFVDSFKEILVQKNEQKPEKELEIQEIPDFLKVKKKNKTTKIKYDKSYYMKINDWKDLFKKHDTVEPFQDNDTFGCVEIGYEDLKFLPSSCRNLINNSFLLHGMYCYGHVLIGHYHCRKKQKIYLLGVPGRFEKSECIFAGMFGFEQFKKASRTGIHEKDFGYWWVLFRDDE